MKRNNGNLRLKKFVTALVLAGAALLSGGAAVREGPAGLAAELHGPFDLAAGRTEAVQYFLMETQFVHIGFDGKRTGTETYILKLKCVPAVLSGKGGEEYTCAAFQYRLNDGDTLSIPALAGWSYVFVAKPEGKDEKGQVFGIPHGKFDDLADSRGGKFPVGIAYSVYNNFIDFHGFNDVFSRPAAGGRGIQDLKTIGQRVIHAAAFSEPPVNLGARIKEGSVFRNGEVSLEFKGLSIVDGAACALVGYDSGESTLKMIMPLGPDKDMVTVGGSEYKGDLYIDLATRWVRKVTVDEFVVTETRLPGPAPKVDSYTVRHLLLRLVRRQEFDQD
jgi:hypothetical protein